MKRFIFLIFCLLVTCSRVWAGDSLGYFKYDLDLRLGISSDSRLPDSAKTRIINDAIEWLVDQVQNRAPCIEKQDTIILSSGIVQYDLNSDIVKRGLRSAVEIRTRYPAYEYVPLGDFGKTSPLTSSANAYKITQFGLKALFDPRPSKIDTVLVFYNAKTNRLASDTAHTLVPADFNEPIERFALGIYYDRIGEKDDANREYSFADQLLEKLILILEKQDYSITIAPKVQ